MRCADIWTLVLLSATVLVSWIGGGHHGAA